MSCCEHENEAFTWRSRALHWKAERDRERAELMKFRGMPRRLERAEAEVAELEHRLACLLDELTGGRMSGTCYDVPTMVQEVEAYFERTQDSEVAELRATIDRVRALHHNHGYSGTKFCDGCRESWPCSTIRALGNKSYDS